MSPFGFSLYRKNKWFYMGPPPKLSLSLSPSPPLYIYMYINADLSNDEQMSKAASHAPKSKLK